MNIAALKVISQVWEILVSKGADISIVPGNPDNQGITAGSRTKTFINQIISVFINATDEQGTTPLHIDAAMGHSQWLKELIETSGVDVNATDSQEAVRDFAATAPALL